MDIVHRNVFDIIFFTQVRAKVTTRIGKSALKADRVESKSVDLNAKGSSEIYVNATERAVLESKGRTSVFYNGNPTIVRTQTKLSATINPIGAR